jgi:hypothetical protein
MLKYLIVRTSALVFCLFLQLYHIYARQARRNAEELRTARLTLVFSCGIISQSLIFRKCIMSRAVCPNRIFKRRPRRGRTFDLTCVRARGTPPVRRRVRYSIAVTLIAAAMLLSFAVLLTHAHHEHDHDGHDGGCAVCEQLCLAEGVLCALGTAAGAAGAVLFSPRLKAAAAAARGGGERRLVSLVSLKVRLND